MCSHLLLKKTQTVNDSMIGMSTPPNILLHAGSWMCLCMSTQYKQRLKLEAPLNQLYV